MPGYSLSSASQSRSNKLRFVVGVVSIAVVAVVVVVPVVLLVNNDSDSNGDSDRPKPPLEQRLNCSIPGEEVTKTSCEGRGCLWVSSPPGQSPHCFLPRSDTYGYVLADEDDTPHGKKLTLHRNSSSAVLLDNHTETIQLDIIQYGEDMVRIKIIDPSTDRYEVPVPITPGTPATSPHAKYRVHFNNTSDELFSFQVVRNDTGAVLFDTALAGLIFSDQFLQIATFLPSVFIYGFGENFHESFRHDLKYRTWAMFARDEATGPGVKGHYGVHPFYTALEEDGNMHGVLLLNSNAMEVMTVPAPGLALRTIGGIIDLFFFLGPEPEAVVQQYTSLIGRPFLPPYWALGFQLCKYGYGNLSELTAAVERTRAVGVPQDIQYADIDYMNERVDFTIDPVNFAGLPDYITQVKEAGLRFIVILDPAIVTNHTNYTTYANGRAKDVFIKWPSVDVTPPADFNETGDTIMLGYVWPRGKVAFPDWFRKDTVDWWINEIKLFYDTLKFDGLWIDMNEPANFDTNMEKPWNWPDNALPYWNLHCPTNTLDDPPYSALAATFGPSNRLSDKTLCMLAVQGEGRKQTHYNLHNLYGWSETRPTLLANQEATGTRGVVISRSTYPTSGQWAGHWLGDNFAQWDQMQQSIIGMMEFNLFGIPYVGADICGFNGQPSEELCQRWMELGSFYPFSRNHNAIGEPPQDPGIWPDTVGASAKKSMDIRYRLLPYLYSLFYRAHKYGGTVVRSLLHEFPTDAGTWTVDRQFLWGSALLISPVLEEGKTSVQAYFPRGVWYDYYTKVAINSSGEAVTVDAPRDHIPLHLRGGYILPVQQPANNTKFSRQNPFGLLVSLSENLTAAGEIYWDDGESIVDVTDGSQYYHADVTYDANHTLSVTPAPEGVDHVSSLLLEDIEILGLDSKPTNISISGASVDNIVFNDTTNALSFHVRLTMNDTLHMQLYF